VQFPEVRITWLCRDEGKIVGRAKELQRAFGEVMKNACQAHAGRAGNLSIACEALGDDLRVRVVDDGQGVPSEFAVKIFEPFFTTRGVGQGLGLGLSTAYGIVNGHGGRIELRSAPGGGTEVEIVLPVAAPAHALPA